jgi:hypothetical protein
LDACPVRATRERPGAGHVILANGIRWHGQAELRHVPSQIGREGVTVGTGSDMIAVRIGVRVHHTRERRDDRLGGRSSHVAEQPGVTRSKRMSQVIGRRIGGCENIVEGSVAITGMSR